MKELIEQLKVLNTFDVKLRMIKKDMERLPKELAEKGAVAKNLKASIERGRAEIMKLKLEADSIELEVKSGEEALKRYAGQMNVMRNSKEWDAVKRQMDAQRAWNRENEGKALAVLEQVDAKQADIDKNTAALAEAEKVLATETERIEKELAELKTQYDAIAAERSQAATDLPDKELVIYTRIMTTHGHAIAKVERGICSACYMKIPAQTHNLALLARELVCCPSCGRILTASNQ